MKKLAAVLVAFLAVYQCDGKLLSRCGLVAELRSQGFPENLLPNWVCLVESESSRRTHVIGEPNRDGSRDHGLFQINDNLWCTNNGAGHGCRVSCADVRSDDITKASACAKKIYDKQGFRAWNGWKKYCQGALPDISSC